MLQCLCVAETLDERQDEESLSELDEEQGAASEPALDPEVARRRTAALAHVRTWGDPVLKAKARPVAHFDDTLVARSRGWGGS